MTDTTRGEMARLTADVVATTLIDGTLHVLLIRRGWPPYTGMWALPGGHVDPGEAPEAAAVRELAEETGLAADELRPLGVWAAPGRDPRARYCTFAFAAWLPGTPTPTAGDDAAAAHWVPVPQALREGLAFDHGEILRAALVPDAVIDALDDILTDALDTPIDTDLDDDDLDVDDERIDHAGGRHRWRVETDGRITGRYTPPAGRPVRWQATATVTT